ncbi:SH2 domain-containing protein 4A [Myxocyprinus asiaticus]|uniref:SH2 domain-containing protein 4A n=1 Tax=Myxocyprinus asiaticus TaxID=70543 RepID=UPI0022226445|nr:SH2 domain-containing protein 4A [Myxocyprinus asiaticus]XP_051506266.1 SH2 domain-containing protein 4A [Myxocyprinus asiaticus]
MLQQILADMYIDPDVLEALNEEQKKILFFKMREEQVRRWKEREEKEGKEGIERPQKKKGPCKSVSWLLGRDGDVRVCFIGESDELKSPKLILSELRDKTVANTNNVNRAKPEPVKSNLTKPNRVQTTSTEPGIQLLLKKQEELSDSSTVSDESKQDSSSDQSADDTRGQTDDSDSGSAEEDTGLYRSHQSKRDTSIADRLKELTIHRAMKEQLSVNDKTHPLDTPDKGVEKDKDNSLTYGSRVAQLRKTFNTTNAKGSSPCVKPPIPSKPVHLLTSPSVR